MRAAADKIHPIEILKAIARPQVQHLIQTVRQIEGRSAMNLILLIPVRRSDQALIADAAGRYL